MPRSNPQPEAGKAMVEVPLDRVAHFLRQVSHDVRNNLGSMDLQAAYAAELVTDPEASAEIRKLRAMVTSTARMLQAISASFWTAKPNLVTLSASILIEDFRERFARLLPEDAARLEWLGELGGEEIAVDIEMIFNVLLELCRNAFHFHEGPDRLTAHVAIEGGEFVLELREKRTEVDSPLETWGVVPLVSTRRGGYGLGLFHARQVVAANAGAIEFRRDTAAAIVITRLRLPLVDSAAASSR